jgi:hypothetical protein
MPAVEAADVEGLKSESDSLMARIRAFSHSPSVGHPSPAIPRDADGVGRRGGAPEEFAIDDRPFAEAESAELWRVRQENKTLRSDVLNVQQQVQAMEHENRNLVALLEKSERARARYKQQLPAPQPTRE